MLLLEHFVPLREQPGGSSRYRTFSGFCWLNCYLVIYPKLIFSLNKQNIHVNMMMSVNILNLSHHLMLMFCCFSSVPGKVTEIILHAAINQVWAFRTGTTAASNTSEEFPLESGSILPSDPSTAACVPAGSAMGGARCSFLISDLKMAAELTRRQMLLFRGHICGQTVHLKEDGYEANYPSRPESFWFV